jgi:hypothetical protein
VIWPAYPVSLVKMRLPCGDDASWGPLSGSDGNIGANPLYTDVSSADATTWDLRLQSGSPAIDAGSVDLTDDDGSASDIGAYGGPGGTDW